MIIFASEKGVQKNPNFPKFRLGPLKPIINFKSLTILRIICSSRFSSPDVVCLMYIYIVACHLHRGSELRWREDMSGGLQNVRRRRVG